MRIDAHQLTQADAFRRMSTIRQFEERALELG